MNATSATPSSPTTSANAPDPSSTTSATGSAVTPDAFFAYCEAQMNGIDAEAMTYFNQQETSNSAKSTLNGILSELQSHSNGFQDQQLCDTLTAQLQTLKTEYPQAGDQIDQMIFQVNTNGQPTGTDDIVSGPEVQKLVTELNDVSTQMDSANQLSMIKLQSAMSAREQILQLTSNILQAINDGDSKVIGNIHG